MQRLVASFGARRFATAAGAPPAPPPVNVALLAKLRKETNLSMARCKEAMAATGGADYAAALAWLLDREKELGQAKAAKVEGRTAADGAVALYRAGLGHACIVEINTETDFASGSPQFLVLAAGVAEAVARCPAVQTSAADAVLAVPIDELLRQPIPSLQATVADALTNTVGRLGEKLVVRRAASLRVPGGLVGAYVHGATPAAPTSADGPTVGRVGVLVGARGPASASALLRQIAQHVAGYRPTALDGDGGLLDQPFLFDAAVSVRAVLARSAPPSPTLVAFERFERGEGIERRASDFAAEVNAQLQRP